MPFVKKYNLVEDFIQAPIVEKMTFFRRKGAEILSDKALHLCFYHVYYQAKIFSKPEREKENG